MVLTQKSNPLSPSTVMYLPRHLASSVPPALFMTVYFSFSLHDFLLSSLFPQSLLVQSCAFSKNTLASLYPAPPFLPHKTSRPSLLLSRHPFDLQPSKGRYIYMREYIPRTRRPPVDRSKVEWSVNSPELPFADALGELSFEPKAFLVLRRYSPSAFSAAQQKRTSQDGWPNRFLSC